MLLVSGYNIYYAGVLLKVFLNSTLTLKNEMKRIL